MKYQICVSGSAAEETTTSIHQLAFDVGKAISSKGQTLVTGATVGLPHYAAMGAMSVDKSKRGMSIGFSPAVSFREHVATYRLPTKEFDYINFTGMEYVGRDIHLVRSADAIVMIGGRMGSLHELTTALESHKVCAILLGSGGVADYTKTLLGRIKAPGAADIIYDTDPTRIVKKVIVALQDKYSDFEHDIDTISE